MFLAGVRQGNAVPIAEPRGIPEFLKSSVNDEGVFEPLDFWLGDHSYSWLTLKEIAQGCGVEGNGHIAGRPAIAKLLPICEHLPDSLIVFGFDS